MHAAIAQPAFGPRAARHATTRSASRPVAAIETPRLVLRAWPADDAALLRVTILLKPGLTEAGWLQLSLGEGVDRAAELAFFLASAHRGRGLMREAARAILPHLVRLQGARMVYANVPADAVAAERVVRSLGLVASSRRGPACRFEKDLCGLI